ncbi:hypothetical protein D3C85_917120 [compost metagenome]
MALLIQAQGKDVLAVDAAADAVAADADLNRLAAAGEPLQARLAGVEADIGERVGAGCDVEGAGEGLARAPVAVFHQIQGDRVHARQGAVGDGDIQGAEVALITVKIGALHLQPQVDAVGIDRLIQHAIKLHMVLAIQIQGDGQDGLAAGIQQGDLVAIDLISGRFAAAGQIVQAGLARLKVQRDQTIAAHMDRQLAVQALARAAFLQADAGVEAEAGIYAVIYGHNEIGAGLVAVDLLGTDGEPQRELIAALMIERASEGDGDLPLDVAARLAGAQLGLHHLHPVAVVIQVITGQQAIAAEFEAERMTVATQITAIEARQGARLIGEGDGVRQQGIGLMADQELALPDHGPLIGEGILGQGDGRQREVGRGAVHQLDIEVGIDQVPVAVAILQRERQAQAVLAVIQTLVPDDAVAAVIGQGQGEHSRAAGGGGEGLAA